MNHKHIKLALSTIVALSFVTASAFARDTDEEIQAPRSSGSSGGSPAPSRPAAPAPSRQPAPAAQSYSAPAPRAHSGTSEVLRHNEPVAASPKAQPREAARPVVEAPKAQPREAARPVAEAPKAQPREAAKPVEAPKAAPAARSESPKAVEAPKAHVPSGEAARSHQAEAPKVDHAKNTRPTEAKPVGKPIVDPKTGVVSQKHEDGSVVHTDPKSGHITQENPDGSKTKFAADGKTKLAYERNDKHGNPIKTQYDPNTGKKVRVETASQVKVTKPNGDKVIAKKDGSQVITKKASGETVIKSKGGTQTTISKDGKTRTTQMKDGRQTTQTVVNGKQSKTVIINNKTIVKNYNTYSYGGRHYYGYSPYYSWSPVYYGCFYSPFYNPWYNPYYFGGVMLGYGIPYAWGGWGYSWYGYPYSAWSPYYGYYYRPYPVYSSPLLWVTDYLISDLLATHYANSVAEDQATVSELRNEVAEAKNDAQAARAEADQAKAEALDAQNTIDEKVKEQVKIQVQATIKAQEAGAHPTLEAAFSDVSSEGAPKHIFAVSEQISAGLTGDDAAEDQDEDGCDLTEGDLIKLDHVPTAEDVSASMRVVTSKKGDCKRGSIVTISLSQLQQFENDFAERVDEGLKQAKDNKDLKLAN